MNHKIILIIACIIQSYSYLISSDAYECIAIIENRRLERLAEARAASDHRRLSSVPIPQVKDLNVAYRRLILKSPARRVVIIDPKDQAIPSQAVAHREKSQLYLDSVRSILNQRTEGTIKAAIANYVRKLSICFKDSSIQSITLLNSSGMTEPFRTHSIQSIFRTDPDYKINPASISAVVLETSNILDERKLEVDSILQCMTSGTITFDRTQNPPLQLNGTPLALRSNNPAPK
ncbi:MAG TPA: hypothetical protein VLG50_06870 [Candidatus Saccharimonadales bacterium]|nr:hypothetical protein [Candidatus Saccharimonadales bacterium]